MRLSPIWATCVAAVSLALSISCAPSALGQTPLIGAVVDRATGPVRNQASQGGEEIVTLRHWRIRKGSFPQFLEASQTSVWPYFEKIGARVIGMWQVIPAPDETGVAPDYDDVYLATRYASVAHWAATRDAAAMGGDGPDYAALQAGLAIRRDLTLTTDLQFLQGVVGPVGPYFLPGTGETFNPSR